MQANLNYVHFAIEISSGKIVNGWEQSEDIKFWSKIDLKDIFPDRKVSEFKILSKQYLIRVGVDPYDFANWLK